MKIQELNLHLFANFVTTMSMLIPLFNTLPRLATPSRKRSNGQVRSPLQLQIAQPKISMAFAGVVCMASVANKLLKILVHANLVSIAVMGFMETD